MYWWKQPNAWCAVIALACLSSIASLELGRLVGAESVLSVSERDDSSLAPTIHTTLKPILPATEETRIRTQVQSVFGTPEEDVLLNHAGFESREAAAQVKALRELYIRKIKALAEQDAPEREVTDEIATDTGGTP
jgi:hypothetical protein